MSTSVNIPLDKMHLDLGGSITIDSTIIETSSKLIGDVNQPQNESDDHERRGRIALARRH